MSKVKKSTQTHYELMYIVANNYTQEENQELFAKIKQEIKEKGGEIDHEEQWGKRKMAYPIKKFHHGYYNLIEFDAFGSAIEEIDKFLYFTNEILRFQVIKAPKLSTEEREGKNKEKETKVTPEKTEKEEESSQTKKDEEESSQKEKKEETEKEEKIKEKEDSKAESPEKEDVATKKEKGETSKEKKSKDDKKELNIEDLDDKLDDILNPDNLL